MELNKAPSDVDDYLYFYDAKITKPFDIKADPGIGQTNYEQNLTYAPLET